MRISIKYPVLARCADRTYMGKTRGATYAIVGRRKGFPELVASATEYRNTSGKGIPALHLVLHVHNVNIGLKITAGGSSGSVRDNQLPAALASALHNGCLTCDEVVLGRGDDVVWDVLEAIAKACGHPPGDRVVL